MFKSSESGKSLTKPRKAKTDDGGFGPLPMSLPTIIEDEGTAADLSNASDQAGDAVNAVSSGNFFIAMLLKGPM